ncbi:hypothetical protein RUM43_009918 [Polyplax serrata]|uniref:Uncharacterized protein n=1 Tax=Polyplax serrata TaxID=468196 RepID=A0AAN8P3A7_POLSC
MRKTDEGIGNEKQKSVVLKKGDNEHEIKSDLSSSGDSSSEDESKKNKLDKTGLVKSLLGPSFEDAVLRTFEFGRYLINKTEDNEQNVTKKPKKKALRSLKSCQLSEDGSQDPSQKSSCKKLTEGRLPRKRIVFTANFDKDFPSFKASQKPPYLSKIRSLDSDLKQSAPSPEKIKRQLEALIQINKDEPPEHAAHPFYMPKKFHKEITVMPSLCFRKKDIEIDACSSAEGQSVKKSADYGQSSTSKLRLNCEAKKKKIAAGIFQAPEFLSSALGPSLDVSIIDNLKMMTNIFKCDSGKGEGACTSKISKQDCATSATGGADDWECKMQELQERVCELQDKEEELLKKIECKKKEFEDEERKLCEMKSCIDTLSQKEPYGDYCKKSSDLTVKYENLRQKIACEEDKLCRLKEQYEIYRNDIMEAKCRKEALKRNKSLLDAWDLIASKACHTRLPSFSRAGDLNRKQMNNEDNVGSLHCCFMNPSSPGAPEGDCPRSNTASRKSSRYSLGTVCSKEQLKAICCKQEEVPFPIQRDVICGMHEPMKQCGCNGGGKREVMSCTSEDDIFKKCKPCPAKAKSPCRSRSDTLLKRNPCSKIVKVLWAITRINIFQDNCKTYEVMDATSTPPPCIPCKTEGIFVVKNPEKNSQQRRRCGHQYRNTT